MTANTREVRRDTRKVIGKTTITGEIRGDTERIDEKITTVEIRRHTEMTTTTTTTMITGDTETTIDRRITIGEIRIDIGRMIDKTTTSVEITGDTETMIDRKISIGEDRREKVGEGEREVPSTNFPDQRRTPRISLRATRPPR